MTEYPTKVGPYRIDSLLHKGGMSLLFLGIDPKTERSLAIKVLSPSHLSNPDMIERFLKEEKIIALTDHPNIVKLYDQGEWDGGLFIAMELIRGISLRELIEQTPVSLKKAVELILQVASALVHLHENGVIHRDLKPENILITEKGAVKVVDFGVALLQSSLQSKEAKSRLAGTPNYMSPEQKATPLQISFNTDIYSLGKILYELVLGKRSRGTLQLSLIPKGLRPIIEKAIEPDANMRYQEIGEFISDLHMALETGSLEREEPKGNPKGDVWEELAKTQASFFTSPTIPKFEYGIAKGDAHTGSTIDVAHLESGGLVFFIATPLTKSVEGLLFSAQLSGIWRSYLRSRKKELEQELPDLKRIIQHFNALTIAPFSLCIAVVNTVDDTGQIACCGNALLWHEALGEPFEKVSPFPTPLGEIPMDQFPIMQLNVSLGDRVVLSCFPGEVTSREPFEIHEEKTKIGAQKLALALQEQLPSNPFIMVIQKTS